MKRAREEIEDTFEDIEEESVSSNGSDSMDISEENDEEEIQVDFEVNEPNFKTDFYGIETYTQLLLNGDEFNYTPIVELLMGDTENEIPNPLTSVVKVPYERISSAPEENEEVDLRDWEWDEDTYGVVSILPFEDEKVSNNIGKWIINNCESNTDQSTTNRIKNILSGKLGSVGLLVNLHVVNLPFELSYKLHENLWNEYNEFLKENKIQDYKNVILITTMFVPKKKKHYNKKKPVHAQSIYPKYEEQFYAKYASFSTRYLLKSSESFANNEVSMLDKTTGDRYGLIMVIPTSSIPKIIQEMNQTLQQPTNTKKIE